MPETTIKMWAPWHPEHGFGEIWAATAFGDLDEAIRVNTAKRIMDDDNRWMVVGVLMSRMSALADVTSVKDSTDA